ncbi:hypothetical protein [Gardnerella vaginalis]|uniref:hypothetical protein n=1 Tax=Gardnerella TaxID=2701 RepID=UPI0039F0ACE2
MSLIEIAVTIIAFLLSVVIGIYFAGIPLRTSSMTKVQNILQQILSVLCFVAVIVLFVMKMRVATVAVIVALVLGMFIGKIPAVHRFLLKQFPYVFLRKNDPRFDLLKQYSEETSKETNNQTSESSETNQSNETRKTSENGGNGENNTSGKNFE